MIADTEEYTEVEAPVMQIPYSPNIEQALLGCILINPTIVKTLPTAIEDFYIDRNKFIFAAIQELHRAGSNIDYLTICLQLDKRGQLAEIGGKPYVMQLINQTPTSLHVDTYANQLKDLTNRRSVITVAENLLKDAYNRSTDLTRSISRTQSDLSKTIIDTDRGLKHISEFLGGLYDQVEAAAANPKDVYGISSGLKGIDRINHGWQKGTTTTIAGEPGLGKSLLVCQFLTTAAKDGHPCGLYEFEMNQGQVIRRMVSAKSKEIVPTRGVSTYKMQSGKMEDDDWPLFTAAIENLSSLPVYMTDKKLTVMEWRADVIRNKELFGIELVAIDYIRLFADRIPDANERDAYLSDMIHTTAVEENIAVLIIDTMNKQGQTNQVEGKPGMSGSGYKVYDQDEVIFMRKAKKPEGAIALTWEKLRDVDMKDNLALLSKLPDYPTFGDFASELPGGRV